MVKPGLNRDRFLLEWGRTEFKRNGTERLVNRQLLRAPRGAAPEHQRSPILAMCSAHLVMGRVAAETSGRHQPGRSGGARPAPDPGGRGLGSRWPPSRLPGLLLLASGRQRRTRGRDGDAGGGAGLPSSCAALTAPTAPQAGVGNAAAGDAGPALRHAVLGSPRRALHVRAHPQGPHLVLLRWAPRADVQAGGGQPGRPPGTAWVSPAPPAQRWRAPR